MPPSLAFLACCLLLLFPRAAAAQTKVLHLKVAGAIDCRKMVDEFAAELERARTAGVALVVLELDGKAARNDLVWLMGQRLRESRMASAALIGSGPGATVGPGQLVLGMLTGHPFLKPRTTIAGDAKGRAEMAALAPEDTDWERTNRELAGALWVSLKARSGGTDIAAALLAAEKDLWVIDSAGGVTLSTDAPADESAATQIVYAGSDGGARLRMDDLTALKLRLVEGTAGGTGEIFSRLGITPAGRESRTIRSGLHSARVGAVDTLRDAAVEVQRVKTTLNFRTGLQHVVTDRDYAEAGRAALGRIADIDAALGALHKSLLDYPELLITPERPGSSSTRPPADSIPGRLDTLRRDLEKHRTTAQEYATRR